MSPLALAVGFMGVVAAGGAGLLANLGAPGGGTALFVGLGALVVGTVAVLAKLKQT